MAKNYEEVTLFGDGSFKNEMRGLENLTAAFQRLQQETAKTKKSIQEVGAEAKKSGDSMAAAVDALSNETIEVKEIWKTLGSALDSVAFGMIRNIGRSTQAWNEQQEIVKRVAENIKKLKGTDLDFDKVRGLVDIQKDLNALARASNQVNADFKETFKTTQQLGAELTRITNAANQASLKVDAAITDPRLLKEKYGKYADVGYNIGGTSISVSGQTTAVLNAQKQLQAVLKSGTQDTKEIAEATAKLNAEYSKLGAVSKNAAADMKPLLGSMEWTIGMAKRAAEYVAVYGGIFAVIGAMKQAITVTVAMDKALHTLAAVLNQTSDQTQELFKNIQMVGVTVGGTAEDINKAAILLARAGVEQDKLVSSTESIVRLSALTGDTLESSSRAMIAYIETFGNANVVGDEFKVSVEDITKNLGYLSNATRASMDDINTMGNYALSASTAMGATIETITALEATFISAGNSASTSGTSIRRFFQLMSASSKEAKATFDKLGIDQEKFLKGMREGQSEAVISEMISRLGKLSKAELVTLTKDMDVLDRMTIQTLAKQATNYEKHLAEVHGYTSDQFKKSSDEALSSVQDTWTRFVNQIKNTVTTFLSSSDNVVTKTLEMATSALKYITENKELLDAINTSLKIMGVTLGIVAASSAFSLMVTSFTKIATLVKDITIGVAGLNTMIAATPWGRLAVVGAAVAYGAWELGSNMFDGGKTANPADLVSTRKQTQYSPSGNLADIIGGSPTRSGGFAQDISPENLAKLMKEAKAKKGTSAPNISGKTDWQDKGKGASAESFLAYFQQQTQEFLKGSSAYLDALLSYNKTRADIENRFKKDGSFKSKADTEAYAQLNAMNEAKKRLDEIIADRKVITAFEEIDVATMKATGALTEYEAQLIKINREEADRLVTLQEQIKFASKKQQPLIQKEIDSVKALAEARRQSAKTIEEQRVALLKLQREQAAYTAKNYSAKDKLEIARASTPQFGIFQALEDERASYEDKRLEAVNKLKEAELKGDKEAIESSKQALDNITAEHEKAMEKIRKTYDWGAQAIGAAWTAFHSGLADQLSELFRGKFTNLGDFLKNLFKNISVAIANNMANNVASALTQVAQVAVKTFGNYLSGIGSGGLGDYNNPQVMSDAGGGNAAMWQANGGVWDNGVQKFAKGGMFTNSIVDAPTMFKFANGSKFGVMGEAGAEAIMPLSRNSQGELGVKVAQQQSLNNLKIEIKNESGQNLEVANTTVGQDMEGMVIGIVLKGLKNNKMGLRDAVGR